MTDPTPPAPETPETPPKPDYSAKALRERFKEAALEFIRQEARIDFWKPEIGEAIESYGLGRFLGFKPDEGPNREVALKRVGGFEWESFRSFSIVTAVVDEYPRPKLHMTIKLKAGAEWSEAVNEAWQTSPNPNPHFLTDNACKLLKWARSEKNPHEPVAANKIGRQACLRGTYWHIKYHFREIQLKADPTLTFKGEGNGYKVWFAEDVRWWKKFQPLNPALPVKIEKFGHNDLETFKEWLYSTIRKQKSFAHPQEHLLLYHIEDRKTLRQCFPEWGTKSTGLTAGPISSLPNSWTSLTSLKTSFLGGN